MSARRVVNGVGRALIGGGLLVLLFVAYQLWGTGIHEARAQSSLKRSFERSLASTTTTTTATPAERPASTTTSTTEALPPPPEGEAVAVLRIPKIGMEKAIVEGVGVPELKKAPGHYPGTPMPGQAGNAAIAGHRTTYGAPFGRLGELQAGDEILVTTHQGRFRYRVKGNRVVSPSQVEVLAPTDDARLTLTTCHPRFSAKQRLVVTAALVGEALPAPPPAPPEPADPAGPAEPGASPKPDAPARTLSFEEPSLSGDRSAARPTVLWGLLAAVVALLTWFVGSRWRRLPAYLLGGAVFLVVLFVFYENVARLLPANI